MNVKHPAKAEGRTVNPELVTLARQVRGLNQSQLAELAGLRQATISKIEAGLIPVSESDLDRLSQALDFPPRFFFGQDRVTGPALPEFMHRKKAKASVTALNRLHAIAAVREMHVRALFKSWEADWRQYPSYPIEEFESNPKRIAQTVRAVWNVPPGPVFNVTKLVEDAGAVVISFDFGTRDIDGFSRWPDNSPPLIFINSAIPPDRWRWSVAHEIGHLAMHAQCDPYPEMEGDANAFAGEFLMPAREIGPQLTRVTIDRLAGLKRYWKVSMQAIIRRAGDLRLITANQKRWLFMQLTKAGYRLREPITLDPPSEPPALLDHVVDYHRRNLRYSDDDLCQVLAINGADLQSWYAPSKPILRAVD